jgi:hypothetical protein
MPYKLYIHLDDDSHLYYVSQLIELTIDNFIKRYCITDKDGLLYPACRFG